MKKNNENRPSALYANMDDFMPIIEERIAAGHSVEMSIRGVSMLPLLREGKDSVILSPTDGELKKFDIPFYRRLDGVYTLHRMVVKEGGTYTMIGDHQYRFERGIRRQQVIAVVTAIRRGKRLVSVNDPIYRLYVSLWHITRPMRHLCFRAVRKFKKIISK